MYPVRGEAREKNLERSAYFSPAYFELPQLFSLAHQIHDVHGLRPENVLEIGIGNGFSSTFLKNAGFDVLTVDINERLKPDICAPIARLEECLEGRQFDLVVCCEVLEHMPFEEFVSSIETFRAIGRRLYLTLPNYRYVFGIGGIFNWILGNPLAVDARIEFPGARKLDREHFWELGSTRETSKRNIRRVLGRYYRVVEVSRYLMNPYHIAFYAHD